MGTLPALVGFQVPQMNLGDTFTAMAKLAAYDQARRTSALELEEKRGRLDREQLWRQTIAGALQPPEVVPGQGFAGSQPQAPTMPTAGLPTGQGPGVSGGGLPAVEPTMPPVGVPVSVNTQTGQWGQPGGFTGAQPGMPPAITGMAPPTDPTQPPLQGGGFTVTPAGTATPPRGGLTATQPGTAPVPQTGLTAPQPTRPLSASVPGLMPMPNAQAVQRAFAIDPEKTSQWYGAYLTQRGKQLDEVKRNNQLVYQVSSAILEHPDYYQEGLDYLREQGVPVPKNMPTTYNAALVAFHRDLAKERMNPLQEAQIENQKAQAQLHEAQAKDVPLRTQLEGQRLGLQGTTATMNDELRAMNVNPLTATAEQRQQAQQNIQQRELAKTREAELQRGKTEAELRGDKTISEVFGERTTKLYDTQTGQTVDARTKVKDYEALPAGRVKELSSNLTEQMEQINNAVPIVAQLQSHIDKIYGPGGVLARMTPDERADLAASPGRWAKQYAQKYPELNTAQRFIDSNASALARALAQEKGAMAEGDVARAKAMLPSLESSLQLWPPNKLAIQAPDTRAVALGTMNNIVDMINARGRTLLGNEQYTHPKLHRYETAAEAQQASGGPGTPPQVAPPDVNVPGAGTFAPPRPTPPAVGLNPRLPPQEPRVPRPEDAPLQFAPPRPSPGRQSQAPTPAAPTRVSQWWGSPPPVMSERDVMEAMRQTGKTRREVEEAARARGYTVPTALA